MASCSTFLKTLIGIFCAYFAILGIALTIYGGFSAYTLMVINSEDTIEHHLTTLPSLTTVALGIVLIFLVFLGCCAICREVPCCLNAYSVFLIILALIHLSLGTYCLVTYSLEENNYRLKQNIQRDMAYAVENYRSTPKRIDNIQHLLECCGNEDPLQDYAFYESELPPSCCNEMVTCLKYSPERYKEGCGRKVYIFTVGTNYFLGWISFIAGISQLIAALLGIWLSCGQWKSRSASW